VRVYRGCVVVHASTASSRRTAVVRRAGTTSRRTTVIRRANTTSRRTTVRRTTVICNAASWYNDIKTRFNIIAVQW